MRAEGTSWDVTSPDIPPRDGSSVEPHCTPPVSSGHDPCPSRCRPNGYLKISHTEIIGVLRQSNGEVSPPWWLSPCPAFPITHVICHEIQWKLLGISQY